MKSSALKINNVLSVYYTRDYTKYSYMYFNLHNHCFELDTLLTEHAL